VIQLDEMWQTNEWNSVIRHGADRVLSFKMYKAHCVVLMYTRQWNCIKDKEDEEEAGKWRMDKDIISMR